MVFNSTFNNISVMSGLLADDTRIPEKNTDLVQITDKLSYSNTPCHERDSNSQLDW